MGKKVALVIGGGGGIGQSVARRLIKDGMQVCVTYFKRKEKIKALQDEFGEKGFSAFECDMTDEAMVKKVMVDVFFMFDRIDIVVFTVSSSLKHGRMLDLEWSDYDSHISLQIKSVLFVVQSLSEQIRLKVKTKFVILLSEYCIGMPPKGLSHYITSKYAVMGLSKTMAVELAQYGCTVNMVTPGMVKTALIDSLPAKLIEITADQNPLKRIAIPSDVSNVVSFLASDESDYLNGTNITVNGGNVMY